MKKIYLKIIEEGGISMGKFSVIIRSKNEENWIGYCIQSIIDHFESPEIIIIDNGSTDETMQIANSFKKSKMLKNQKNFRRYSDIKIYSLSNYTPGKSLNFGLKKCKNENILIISAHCVIKKVNVQSTLKNLAKYKAIFGNQTPIWKGKRIIKRYIWSHFVNKKVENMFSKLENRYFFHNAASIFKKSTLKKMPFDEDLSGKEDRYWANKLVKSKFKYLYDPSFSVDHHYTSNGATWKGLA